MTYFFDTIETVNSNTVHHKGRVYKIVDRHGNLKWYSVEQTATIDGKELAASAFSDFDGGRYLDISQSDLDRALTRKSKI